MKSAQRLGNMIFILIALAATVGAVAQAGRFAVSFSSSGAPLGSAWASWSVCGVGGSQELLIAAYLEANADLLEQPAGASDTPVKFIVEEGETAGEIAAQLKELNLISDAELFRRYVQYHKLDAGIEAGEYTLRQTMTIPEIARALQKGRRPEQEVVIREGLRLEEVAVQVATQTGIPQQEFLTLVTTGWRNSGLGYAFLSELPENATLEGFLFPETYRLPEDATAMDVVSRMLETFDTRVNLDMRAAAANRGLNVHQLVTLASIVEREAVLEDERPLIAGVYHNRLAGGWFLGADPTVQYGLNRADNWWPVLTLSDLESPSPYNTYRNLGLPPGPICSPGLSSIRAAAYPTETNYYYFMADCTKNDGSHLFAATEAEHNRNYVMCGGATP